MGWWQSFTKALASAPYPESGVWAWAWDDWHRLTPTEEDFRDAVINAHRSSLVMGCIEYVIANATSTPWRLEDKDGETVENHAVLDLLNNPTPYSDGTRLLSALITSLCLSGNAYALRVGNRLGVTAELHYVPHTQITIKTTPTGGISHYIYRVEGRDIRIPVEDMIHIRRWHNWQTVHHGIPPIASLGPEIWIDMESARFTANILKNQGVPGLVLSPHPGDDSYMSPDDLRDTRDNLQNRFTGANRAKSLVLGKPMNITTVGMDPQSLELSAAHNYAEERITAAFGLPAAVIGFGIGLEQTKVGATLQEQERQAWQGGIIPIQNLIAQQLHRALLHDEGDALMLTFDRSHVNALQEKESDVAARWAQLVAGGIATRAEARAIFNLDVQETDEVYLQPASVIEVPQGVSLEERDRQAAELRAEFESESDDEDENEDEDSPNIAEL